MVTEEGVSARVGSRFSDIREVVQVRLRKGEVVEILEGPPHGGGGNGWFKIAPPSGEFRWVSAKYLDANYPRDGVRKAPPSGQKRADRQGGVSRRRNDRFGCATNRCAPARPSRGRLRPRSSKRSWNASNWTCRRW